MIQRIQTLYLLVSVILLGLLFQLPLAEFAYDSQLYVFKMAGLYNGESQEVGTMAMLFFLSLIVILHLFVIFTYKKRILQIRILVFTIILLLGLFGMFFYFVLAVFDHETISYKIPLAFPVVAAILDFLAIREIGKDEALIRSLNRLR